MLASTKPIWLQGVIDILPISVAIIPWGILAGSLAIEAGLSPIQAQCMSLFVFAGAAQLAALNLVQIASPVLAILTSTFVISSRHLLYSAVYRPIALSLSRPRRYLLAFLLTDEMFAVVEAYREKHQVFHYSYAVAAGFSFYIIWNFASLGGILLGVTFGNMTEHGFDFAIAAIFIAMVVPNIKTIATLVSVLVSGSLMVIAEINNIDNSILLAGIGGMICAYLTEKATVKKNEGNN